MRESALARHARRVVAANAERNLGCMPGHGSQRSCSRSARSLSRGPYGNSADELVQLARGSVRLSMSRATFMPQTSGHDLEAVLADKPFPCCKPRHHTG